MKVMREIYLFMAGMWTIIALITAAKLHEPNYLQNVTTTFLIAVLFVNSAILQKEQP